MPGEPRGRGGEAKLHPVGKIFCSNNALCTEASITWIFLSNSYWQNLRRFDSGPRLH